MIALRIIAPATALLAAVLLLPGSAAAMRGEAALAPRLAKLASAGLRHAVPARQDRSVGLRPGGLARDGRLLLANVRFKRGALASLGSLRRIGGRVVVASRRYQTVTVAATAERLRAVATLPRVESVTPVFSPILASTCSSGSIVSEGDSQLRADQARSDPPEPDGSGVAVGVLSDSFDQAQGVETTAEEDVVSGDLPGEGSCPETPVEQVGLPDDRSDPSDEGRAMAQIVHDLAPGATLKFASAENLLGELAFAQNIGALAEAGADVLVDDISYPEEPFFQDGPIAVAARQAEEEHEALYLSAAGNNSVTDGEGHQIASWETPKFREAGKCPAEVQPYVGPAGTGCLDFDPGESTDTTFGIRVAPKGTLTIDLQWDEPRYGVGTDLDAFLLDSSGHLVRASAEDNPTGGFPLEYLEWKNSSSSPRVVQLVVNRYSGGSPRIKFALLENGSEAVEATEYPRSSGADVVGPTIFGHSGSSAVIATGATPSPSVAAFSSTAGRPEAYSSRGPVRHDFGPVEEGEEAAEKLPSPEIVSKPDLTATDCVQTTFFSQLIELEPLPTGWYFCGTSAAAPHAAAVAALMLDPKLAAEPAEVRDALIAGAAMPFDPEFGPCDVGAGLVDAVQSITELATPTPPAAQTCKPPEPEVEPGEARAAGDWGSESPPAAPEPSGSASPIASPAPPKTSRRPPRTFFKHHPRHVVHTRHHRARVVFRFGSNVIGVSYACRVDGGLFRICPRRFARRYPIGRHTLRVAARDREGIGDRTPAVFHFRVKSNR